MLCAGQARQLIRACEGALSSGIFYAPVATCTEEAADFAAQQMELPSTEWFQLPKAATGIDNLLIALHHIHSAVMYNFRILLSAVLHAAHTSH